MRTENLSALCYRQGDGGSKRRSDGHYFGFARCSPTGFRLWEDWLEQCTDSLR
jgi:hypothetical protein